MFPLPRKTDSSNPADWIWISESDIAGISELANRELSYELCRGKLAEVIEKVLKAELIRTGWLLVRTHDLEVLGRELYARDATMGLEFKPLVVAYAEVYFSARYPGFDLDEPNWAELRRDIALVEKLLAQVKARIV